MFFVRIKRKIDDFIYDLKNRIYAFRHGRPKWAYWNCDMWFIYNIIPILDSLIENSEGHPYGFKSMREYKNTLREMRYGFKLYRDVHYDMIGYDEIRAKYGISDRADWKRLTDEDRANWDAANHEWWDLEDRAKKSLDRSMNLFKGNFSTLWD